MELEFPELMRKLHSIEIDYADGYGIDFEPFERFYSPDEASDWIKAWTGNAELDGQEYLIFGQDGSGGYAAFWCVRETSNVLKQPIVFFGSEGELGVVARNFYEYLWLFASGLGPYEAVEYPDKQRPIDIHFVEFAEKYSSSYKSTASEVINKAKIEFPNFVTMIQGLCR